MSDESISVEMEGVKITKIVTSQSETLQAKQFEANNYFTSMEVTFGSGLDITDKNNLQKLLSSAALANTLCTANNRRNQWRDGLAPRIGSSANGYLEANAGNLDNNSLYRPENILDPKNIGKLTNELMKKVKEALAGIQAVEKVSTTERPVEQVAAPAKATSPSEPPQQTPAKRRVNPARTAAAPSNQEVVN